MAYQAFKENAKTITLPNNTKYAYVHIGPTVEEKPHLLFLHGFPESPYDWLHQIHFAREKGFGIIAPDLLGYGDTDKPDNPKEYRMKKMAEEVMGILDAEGIDKVIGVGHDWGSIFLGRINNYFPDRFHACIFVVIGYIPPTGRLQVEELNAATKQMVGFEAFGYMFFFNEDDSTELCERNPRSMTSLCFNDDANHWRHNFSPPGAARKYLVESKSQPLPSWVSQEMVDTRDAILKRGGYTGPLNWYRASLRGCNNDDEAAIREDRKKIDVKTPVLLVTVTRDVLPAAMTAQMTMQGCENLTVKGIDAGHFLMWEKPDELNAMMEEWLGVWYSDKQSKF